MDTDANDTRCPNCELRLEHCQCASEERLNALADLFDEWEWWSAMEGDDESQEIIFA